MNVLLLRSSLTYNTSTSHERHEQHEYDTSAIRLQRKCNTSATRTMQVQHECYRNDTSTTRVKNFDFDNDTSKNTSSHLYIYYMASKKLQGDEYFYSKNYFQEMPHSHAKMRLKSAPQKLSILMAKAISNTLNCSCKCPCTFPHSYAQ